MPILTATIKAGTYRFNDVLSAPSADIRGFVDFSLNITSPTFGDIYLKADRFDVYADGSMDYVAVESQPDLSAYGASFPLTVGVWNGSEWSNVYQADGTQTITITEDTDVSDEFAEWFTANTKPVTATIIYNGSTIASLLSGQTATLKCAGMEMESDVVVEVAENADVTHETDNYTALLQELENAIVNLESELEGKASGGEQITPIISVNSDGLITATAGEKTATKQLTTQAAKVITPSTTSQVAVASDVYTTGVVTVSAIPESYIVPSGTLTITTNGTHDVKNYALATVSVADSGGGDSNSQTLTDLITGKLIEISDNQVESLRDGAFYRCYSLTTVNFPQCTTMGSDAFAWCRSLTTVSFPNLIAIGSNAFCSCSKLTTASFPQCETVGSRAFYCCTTLETVSIPKCITLHPSAFGFCSKLTTANFPKVTIINSSAFYKCFKLTTVSFPQCTTISTGAFRECSSLTTVSFPQCTTIIDYAFQNCTKLQSVFLPGSTVVTITASSVFANTKMSTTGYFYVPSSLISQYQAATNWAYFSSRFSAIENYSGWDGKYGGTNDE